MKRGDIATVSAPGDYGKPRPAVIVQADAFLQEHDCIVVCLMTSHQVTAPLFRIPIDPKAENGLREATDIMVDKVVTMRREKIGGVIGELDDETLMRLTRSFIVFYRLIS